MAVDNELVVVDAEDLGLDRAHITSRGQIQISDHIPQEGRDNAIHLRNEPEMQSSTHRVVNSLKQKKHDAAVKVREKLHMKKVTDDLESSTSPVLADTADYKSESRLDGKSTAPEKHSIRGFIQNPVDTVKSKTSNKGNQEVAANIAAKEIPHGQDVDVVKASSAVERARSEHEKMLAVQNLDELLKLRQSTYVRWTLDRHVTKIRVLPRDRVEKKSRGAFERKDAQGSIVLDWKAYGKHVSGVLATEFET